MLRVWIQPGSTTTPKSESQPIELRGQPGVGWNPPRGGGGGLLDQYSDKGELLGIWNPDTV